MKLIFKKRLIFFTFYSIFFYNCTTNTERIEKKIGLKIPSHKETTNNSHFLGFDYFEEFECTFNEKEFNTLCYNIENSPLYNFCEIDSFTLLSTNIKMSIIKGLKSTNLTGFWISENETYRFYQPTTSLDHFDTVQVNRALESIILENERLEISDTMDLKKFPYIIFNLSVKYYIEATVNKENNKLTYKLIYV